MIQPTAWSSPNLTLTCDTCGWSGFLPISNVDFSQNLDGTPNRRYIILTCGNPTCNSSSTHPIGGGARPRKIQALFMLKLMQESGLTFLQAKTLVKTTVENMDFVGRFQWEIAQTAADLSITQENN